MDKQPTLTSERLILRPYSMADAPMVQKLAGDKRIADMVTNLPHPYLDGMAEDWIGNHKSWFETRDTVAYAIILRESDELVGTISLNMIEGERANLGYWIGVPYWGNGYCTEAAKEIIKFGFENYGLSELFATHLKLNPASGKVMKKNGFKYIKDEMNEGRAVLYYELSKPHTS